MIYNNSFFNPKSQGSKQTYESNNFEEYKGFFIVHREKSINKLDNVFDIVKDEKIISMRVTKESCKKYIESLKQEK